MCKVRCFLKSTILLYLPVASTHLANVESFTLDQLELSHPSLLCFAFGASEESDDEAEASVRRCGG